jgi:hypothetical protein
MRRGATLYLHYPCFDGVVSAVLARNFLEREGWQFRKFVPISYEHQTHWPLTKLKGPCAVVDFMYHPGVQFWADHHSTTFLNEALRAEFQRRKRVRSAWQFLDTRATSCAGLLWRKLPEFPSSQRARLYEMVRWADKIDSARYASVEEAIWGGVPAMQIAFSLLRGPEKSYCVFLLNALRAGSLAEVAQLSRVRGRYSQARAAIEKGLDRFKEHARLEDEIVTFDIAASSHDIISRYAPYYFFPRARYSIGMVREAGRAPKITAMRNPWRNFESVHLGEIFRGFGGGGHQRVGAVILKGQRSAEAAAVLRKLVAEVRMQDMRETAPAVA